MDLIFAFLLLRDLARTIRSASLLAIGVMGAFASYPFNEGVAHFQLAGVSLRIPQPGVLALSAGVLCEIVLAVLKFSNPKLFEEPMDGGGRG